MGIRQGWDDAMPAALHVEAAVFSGAAIAHEVIAHWSNELALNPTACHQVFLPAAGNLKTITSMFACTRRTWTDCEVK